MKYRLKLVKVTSPNTERPVKDWDIPKLEIKGKSLKVKFLPQYSVIKEAIRNDIFRKDDIPRDIHIRNKANWKGNHNDT